MRKISGKISYFVKFIASLMAFYNIYALLFTAYDIVAHMALNLAFVLPLTFLLYPMRSKDLYKVPLYDYILAIISFIPPFLLYLNYMNWVYYRIALITKFPIEQAFLGLIFLICILEATRRCIGTVMMILAVFFIMYLYLGPSIPYTPLSHSGLDFIKIIEMNYVTTIGVFSITLMVMTTYVISFTILGAMFSEVGIGDFFISFAKALVGKMVGGPAKMAVIASSLFGMISGSAVANVYGTGIITIPTMKKLGYDPKVAAAVEAVASTGGQIMPPILGAAAFVMAEFLQVHYAVIMIAAIIPALLYYLAVYTQVHYFAVREGLGALTKEEIPNIKDLLLKKGYMLIPIIALIYIVAVMMWSPVAAAFIALFISMGLSFVRKETRLTPKKLIKAFSDGAINSISVIVAGASVGIIVGSIAHSGLATKLTRIIYDLAFGITNLALLYLAISIIIIGMGVPTTAAYLVTSALAVPTLSLFKVGLFEAHFFTFYYATLSAITPPVALAAFAAAGLAGTHPFRVGLLAAKLGFAGLLIPFVFVWRTELLIGVSDKSLIETFLTLSIVAIGTYFLAIAFEGFIKRRLNIIERIVMFACGLLTYIPTLTYNFIGIMLGMIILSLQYGKLKLTHK